MISSLIRQDLIRLRVMADDWQDAVRKGGQVLLQAECILPEYIDAMIQSINEAGPYVVIAKHIAMPHAKSECGALKEGVSVISLKTPVYFGNEDNDPVKYVFCLSSVGASNHLDLMQDLVDILEQEAFFRLLDEAGSPKEVFDYILQFDKQGGE